MTISAIYSGLRNTSSWILDKGSRIARNSADRIANFACNHLKYYVLPAISSIPTFVTLGAAYTIRLADIHCKQSGNCPGLTATAPAVFAIVMIPLLSLNISFIRDSYKSYQ